MLNRRIEEASLNPWPALQQLFFDGWIVRFAQGYTKRANSVTPLYPSTLDVEQKIKICADWYVQKSLPPVFRVTPFSSSPDLDHSLERHGFQKTDPSSVLKMDLRDRLFPSIPAALSQRENSQAWLEDFCRLSGFPIEQHQTHRAMIQAIPGQCLFAALIVSGQAVACGLGVLEGEYFGLFDVVTAPAKRRKGYGTQLILGLLKWAQEQGAGCAYLQVTHSNEIAQHLYVRIGFQETYQYWYRVAMR